ncbi:efflux transporter, RND family, MFP subunit [Pseudopedobacter saltans DSM 12145]|uniref:Efflux transporter, RND family, MFP subunit n=1 Tax=Pseudopedobacter saltans (strain ATCC 51119 / DSM 12145 / JCM 21818 / CCUG 39354 / LMG 10337 / NBRC 100064 / NCIMB 13643) TaxID=762903 RepID=F0SCU2_PSESL|nr:efflux RND transporter periplasmic adaptor subunit [Pseudopedobacter saltans]ADY50681.1 efflux transporter, RND family, MFP subunit [Pseudopedobacter saltans DSM 12145]
MKIIIKILFIAVAILSLNSCGETHKNGDGNSQNTATKDSETTEESQGEESPTIASLTQEQIKAVGITLGNIENKNLTATIKANGALRVPNNNKANATSLYGGVVKTLKVQLGDYVRKGQVIATIENPQFIQLQEEYLTIDNRITFAEQEMQRQKELNAGNAGALKNLQNATAELNTLKTRKASLRKQIQLMGIDPASITSSNLKSALLVTSPVNGTVSSEFAKIGSYVDVSSPVVEIVDNSLLHLDLQVFEKDLPHIKIGQAVNFTLTNNPMVTYTARVFNIGSSFEDESKTVAVHCTVIGNKTDLIDGMNITGMISIGDLKTATVPNEAIVEADGKFYIFVQTDQQPAADHEHQKGEKEEAHSKEHTDTINFEKIEVAKGVSELGYTAITPVTEIPKDTKIVTKGAFFINAKLSNTGEHEH